MFKPRPSALDLAPGASMIPTGSKRLTPVRGQRRRPHQQRTRLVDGLVNALVTQPLSRADRKLAAQMTLISGGPHRCVRRSAIWIRSSWDRNLALICRTASRYNVATNPTTSPLRQVL